MRILIVGGAGFLGSNLARRCIADRSNQVTVLDSLEPRLRATPETLVEIWNEISFIRGDMRDEPLIAAAVRDKDVIINCAAQTSHPLSLQDPLFDAEINCIGNLKLLEAVRLLNRQAIVIYTSSSTVVGKAVGDVVDEMHGERPLDIYSANKGVAEKYYRIYHCVHDIRTVVLRFANLYGPYGKAYPEFGFVNYFIALARRGEPIPIYGTGQQLRNVMYVEDAADILYLAALEPKLIGDTYFAAHSDHLRLIDIAQAIVNEFQRGSVRHVEWPDQRRRIEVDDVRISSRALSLVTQWSPRYSLPEGLRRTRAVSEGVVTA